MRRFYLEANGERKSLNAPPILFGDPYGLGMERGLEFASFRSGFYGVVSNDNDPQSVGGGKLWFVGASPYTAYRDFMTWCQQADDLVLVYSPDGTEFRRNVVVRSATKGELNDARTLIVDIEFSSMTPWFTSDTTTVVLQTATANALVFDAAGSVFDSAVFAGNIYPGAAAEVFARGQIPSAFRLTAMGSITNPTVSVVGVSSGTEYGRAEISGAFSDSEGLIVDTTVDGAGVYKIASDGTKSDYISSVNLHYDPFPLLPVVEPCFIKVDSEGGAAGIENNTEAVIYHYYRTV